MPYNNNLAGGIPEPSFVFGGDQIGGVGYVPQTSTSVQLGSGIGVPPVQAIAGQTPDQSGTAAVQYGAAAAARAPHQQPVFWLVTIMLVSIVMLSHVARLSLKG